MQTSTKTDKFIIKLRKLYLKHLAKMTLKQHQAYVDKRKELEDAVLDSLLEDARQQLK